MEPFFTSHQSNFSLRESRLPADKGFRACQLGAIWAVKSHFTVSNERVLINLPTGAGKTAVMMALAFELGARRVFILTPSAFVREQTAQAFATLEQLFDQIAALPLKLKTVKARPRVKEVANELGTDRLWKNLL